MRNGALVSLIAVLLSAAPVSAQDLRFESGEHLAAVCELLEGGVPLEPELFRRGWPTDAAYKRLTGELTGEAGQRVLAAYLASGAGLTLSASTYEDQRFLRQARAGNAQQSIQQLVRFELGGYKQLAGATLQLPQAFDPVVVPYQRARAELEKSYAEGDVTTWRWKAQAGQTKYALDGLGFALLAQSRLAALQLAVKRKETQAGREVQLLGRTADGGFWGLVALHCAVAQLHELRALVIDAREEKASPRQTLQGLDEISFMFPSVWQSTPAPAGPPVHALDPAAGDQPSESLKSYLFGLSAVLLGASELYAITDTSAGQKTPITELFAGNLAPFEPTTNDVALDVALFAFRSLRSLHVNVIRQRATSLGSVRGGGNSISPTDLGTFLLALRAFREKVVIGAKVQKHPRAAELTEEQSKAGVLVSTLGGVFTQWAADSAGFYDRYVVETNAKSSDVRSLAGQGYAIRGLLVAHRQVAQGQTTSPFLDAALRTARWLDRERWDGQARTYVEMVANKPSTKLGPLGALGLLAALRELSLVTDDGRYLERYRQVLESLSARGLVRAPADKVGLGLAAEVAFEGGPK